MDTNRESVAGHRFLYRYQWSGYLMLLPAFLLLTVFGVVPIIIAVCRSFFEYNSYAEIQKFVGFQNFARILETPEFVKSLGNVLLLSLFIVTLTIVCAFFFALVLKAIGSRLSGAVKVIIYVPYLLSGIVASILFLFLTNFGGGLINSVLITMGKRPIAFAIEGLWPYLSIILPAVWLGFGYNTLVLYAGMLNIPKEYYEAAMLDGASDIKTLVFITLPNLKNYFVLLIIGLITANLQMFELPFMMTGGAPLNKTLTPVLYLFNSYRDPNQQSSATIAGALLVMIPIVLINLVVFRLIKSEKSQDA